MEMELNLSEIGNILLGTIRVKGIGVSNGIIGGDSQVSPRFLRLYILEKNRIISSLSQTVNLIYKILGRILGFPSTLKFWFP